MASCSLWDVEGGAKNDVTAGRAPASPVSKWFHSWMQPQGRPRNGNWLQPRAQTNKQIPVAEAGLRSNWKIKSMFKIGTRCSDSCQGQDPVEWFLGRSTVMTQVQGQSTSAGSMARHSNYCSWAGNWHTPSRDWKLQNDLKWDPGPIDRQHRWRSRWGFLRVSEI